MSDKQNENQKEHVTANDQGLADLIDKQSKLILMEADLKQKCDEYDETCVALQNRELKIEKREKVFEKKHATLSDSESFGEMVKLIDQVYTLYVMSHNSDKGLYDAIKLLLDARERYNTKLD